MHWRSLDPYTSFTTAMSSGVDVAGTKIRRRYIKSPSTSYNARRYRYGLLRLFSQTHYTYYITCIGCCHFAAHHRNELFGITVAQYLLTERTSLCSWLALLNNVFRRRVSQNHYLSFRPLVFMTTRSTCVFSSQADLHRNQMSDHSFRLTTTYKRLLPL